MSNHTLLLMSIGSAATVGTMHMLRATTRGASLRVIGVGPDANTPLKHYVDRFYPCPLDDIAPLLDVCAKEKISLVIPQHDRDLDLLVRHREKLEALGARLLVSKTHAIKIALDKGQLLQHFATWGLPVPDHNIVTTPDELQKAAYALGYPHRDLIVKPVHLYGARGVSILSAKPIDATTFFTERAHVRQISLKSLLDVMERTPHSPELIISEHLSGPEYTVDLFRGQHETVVIPRIRTQILGGLSLSTRLDYHPEVQRISRTAAEKLDLTYLVGFQFRLNQAGVPMILECNPRVQGTTIASFFSGLNLLELAFDEALGTPPKPQPRTLQTATFSRHWGGIASGDFGQRVVS